MNRLISSNDLELIAALAKEGSLSGAGRFLNVSHATVLRHLNGVEERLGTRLYERDRNGFRATSAGEEALLTAGKVIQDIANLELRLKGQDILPSGTIRLTTTDALLYGLLSPIIQEFGRTYPEIRFEIAVSNRPFDLNRREADVAIRPASSPPESLYGRKLVRIEQAVFSALDIKEEISPDDFRAHDWIGPDEAMHYRDLERWMSSEGLEECCTFRVDSVLGMQAAARNGIGLCILPLYLGDGDPQLKRVSGPIPALETDLWFLVHPELQGTGRIKALFRALHAALPDHVASKSS